MKPSILLLCLLLNVLCTNTKTANEPTDTVYLCGSGKGKKYHLAADCRGLSNCSYKAVKTTLEKAMQEGKTLCGWEDGNKSYPDREGSAVIENHL